MPESSLTPKRSPRTRRRRRRRPFAVGPVLFDTFTVWFTAALPMTVIGFAVFAPYLALTQGEVLVEPRLAAMHWACNTLLVALLVHGVLDSVQHDRSSLWISIGRGLARLHVVIPVAVVVGGLTGIGYALDAWVVRGTSIGFIGPLSAVVVATVFVAVVPVAVVEREGVLASLVRGWRLSAGDRLLVFVVFLLLGVATTLAASLILGLAQAMTGATASFDIAYSFTNIALQPIAAVATSLIYLHLRHARDGVQPDGIEGRPPDDDGRPGDDVGANRPDA